MTTKQEEKYQAPVLVPANYQGKAAVKKLTKKWNWGNLANAENS